VLWRRYESTSFDVLWSVGISLIFKIWPAQVQFWIFWINCSEIHENEPIKNILKFVVSEMKIKLRKMQQQKQKQQQQQQQQQKYKIIYLKNGRDEPYTLRGSLSCCYQTLETCSRLVLTNCRSS